MGSGIDFKVKIRVQRALPGFHPRGVYKAREVMLSLHGELFLNDPPAIAVNKT
jgi:hypothetical protein